jgi:PAS domain S-box-containing protein
MTPKPTYDELLQKVKILEKEAGLRKSAEEALRSSEARYRHLVKYAPTGIYEADFIKNRFVRVNDAMCRFTGYTSEELLSMEPMDILTEDSRQHFAKRIKMLFNGEPVPESVEFKIRSKDGRETWASLNVHFINENGKPKGATVVAHDITELKKKETLLRKAQEGLEIKVAQRTAELLRANQKLEKQIDERKQVEADLRESEERFRSLLEYLPAISIQGYTSDGTVRYWNKASEGVYGYSNEEAVGRNLADLIIPEDFRPLFEEALKRGSRARRSGEFMPAGELVLRRKDGSSVPVYSIHTVVCLENRPPLMFCIDVDLSERKKAEEALRTSEEKYRSLVDNMDQIIFATNRDRKITFINPAVEKIMGYRPDELIGKRMVDFLPPEDLPVIAKRRLRILAGRTETFDYRVAGKHGQTRYINVCASPIYENGAVAGIQGVITDVTETRLLQDQLIRSERLAATGKLAASIAHEINSPLQGVTSMLSLMQKKYAGDPALINYVELLQGAFGRIRDTVRNLLDLNRPGNEIKQLIDINCIIEKTVELVTSLTKKHKIRMNLNLAPDLPKVYGSPQQLNQVLLNIINNAVEALTSESNGGGIPYRQGCTLGCINIESLPADGSVTVRVADNGPGIPSETLPYIFDPYYTRKKKMGMGIGLSICHGIVEDHHGRIEACNNPEGGAVFTIRLPFDTSSGSRP